MRRLVSGPVMREPYNSLHTERIRAHEKHGDKSAEAMTWDNPRWLPIITEEVGEVARVINERDLGNVTPEMSRLLLVNEVIQVAAMCAAWIDALRGESTDA